MQLFRAAVFRRNQQHYVHPYCRLEHQYLLMSYASLVSRISNDMRQTLRIVIPEMEIFQTTCGRILYPIVVSIRLVYTFSPNPYNTQTY